MSRVVGLFLTALLVSVASAAQTPPQLPPGFSLPPRDTSAAQIGTAVIRGRVFDQSNGRPLRKVQIRAFAAEIRETRLAITDNNGAYELKSVVAGRYQMQASKGSFVALQYGQTRPFEQGKPLEVGNAQGLDKIDFSLPHGAIVTGRIVDEIGEPTSDVQVLIQRYQYSNGRRQLSMVRTGTTNDIGEYRLFGMPPGQYVVSATLRGFNINDAPSDDRSGYAPTFYPGTINATEAQRVTLGVGQILNDINIALTPTRLARISGTAVDSQGKPITGIMMVIQTTGGGFISTSGGQIKPDGSFVVANVAPGDYMMRASSPAPPGGGTPEVAAAEVTVAGDDITDLRLVSTKPTIVTGRVIMAAGSASPPNFGQLTLLAAPKTFLPLGPGGGGRVNEDGTFELSVQPGAAMIRMNPTGSFAGTRIKAVRLGGVDVTDAGIDFKPNENVSGLEVELTTQLSSVSGLVTDGRGNVKDYSVVVFPRDKEHWSAGSRYLNFARPDQDGKYKAIYLPQGDYYAIALDYVEQGAYTDPEFLDRMKEKATEFSIADGETRNLDLKLVASF